MIKQIVQFKPRRLGHEFIGTSMRVHVIYYIYMNENVIKTSLSMEFTALFIVPAKARTRSGEPSLHKVGRQTLRLLITITGILT